MATHRGPRYRRRFVPEPQAARAARRALEPLVPELSASVLSTVRLLTSELVTNSILHAGMGGNGLIQMDVDLDAARIRITVRDTGPGFEPPIGLPSPTSQDGRGIFIVDALADRWSIEDSARTSVWFEIDRQRAERAAVELAS